MCFLNWWHCYSLSVSYMIEVFTSDCNPCNAIKRVLDMRGHEFPVKALRVSAVEWQVWPLWPLWPLWPQRRVSADVSRFRERTNPNPNPPQTTRSGSSRNHQDTLTAHFLTRFHRILRLREHFPQCTAEALTINTLAFLYSIFKQVQTKVLHNLNNQHKCKNKTKNKLN